MIKKQNTVDTHRRNWWRGPNDTWRMFIRWFPLYVWLVVEHGAPLSDGNTAARYIGLLLLLRILVFSCVVKTDGSPRNGWRRERKKSSGALCRYTARNNVHINPGEIWNRGIWPNSSPPTEILFFIIFLCCCCIYFFLFFRFFSRFVMDSNEILFFSFVWRPVGVDSRWTKKKSLSPTRRWNGRNIEERIVIEIHSSCEQVVGWLKKSSQPNKYINK